MTMDEIAMVREGNRLAPVDEMSAEELQQVPIGKQVLVSVHVPRNLKQHRLAWALATKVAEACDFLHDRDDAMAWLKIKARHVRYIHDHHNGETQIIPKSIRFASLDQQAFARVLNRMIYVTVTKVVPGLDESLLRQELEAMTGIEPPTKNNTRRKRAPKSQQDGAKPTANTSDTEVAPSITKGGTHTIQSLPAALVDAGTHGQPSFDGSLAAAGSTPHNAKEWVAYSVRWLTEAREKRLPSTEIMARWTTELKLRMACGITPEERDPVFEIFTEVVSDLRKSEAMMGHMATTSEGERK